MKPNRMNFIVTNECETPRRGKGIRFDGETLAALRLRLPEYLAAIGVELHKKGSRLVGLCPVHPDTSPSLHVFGSRHETCGCFPCGFIGDAFAVSNWTGHTSSFPEAVQDVAAAVGFHIPQFNAGSGPRAIKAPQQRQSKQLENPFNLSDKDRQQIHAARLAFSDAFHSGDSIVDRIAASLGFDREILRLASFGSSGLGLAKGWLCYAYPHGLKWRNPDSKANPRFCWLVGKALAPWRWEWACQPEVHTVYLAEGESDCLALIASGLETAGNAACVACPGTSFPQAWAPLFRGKRVVICFDLDQPGRAATAHVAEILTGHADEILTWKGPKNHE